MDEMITFQVTDYDRDVLYKALAVALAEGCIDDYDYQDLTDILRDGAVK